MCTCVLTFGSQSTQLLCASCLRVDHSLEAALLLGICTVLEEFKMYLLIGTKRGYGKYAIGEE